MTLMKVREEEGGYTLVEMLVVVFILSIVLAVLYRGLDNMQIATQGSEERLTNLEEARVMMANVTKDLRTASRLDSGTSPFILANSREMIFYAYLGKTSGGPSRVRFYVDSTNRLVEQVTAAGGTAPNYTYTGTPVTRSVTNNIVPTGAIFKYHYFSNTSQTFVELASVPLSQTDRDRVQSVEITISVQQPSGIGTPPATLVNRVRLANVFYNPVSAGS